MDAGQPGSLLADSGTDGAGDGDKLAAALDFSWDLNPPAASLATCNMLTSQAMAEGVL